MRWPLRYQILGPLAALILVTLVGVSLTSAALSVRRTRGEIEGQLRDVARTLVEARFPLSDNVLRQMRGLSGAEFVLSNAAGEVVAVSSPQAQSLEPPSAGQIPNWQALTLTEAVPLGGQRYFHVALQLQSSPAFASPQVLHLLYPELNYRAALREAIYPTVLIGGVALVLAVLVGTGIAARVSRPMGQLQRQVDQIAQGDWRPMPLPERDDEIRDLAEAINHMAETLARYEQQVRRSEQLRTLGQLGGGIAHQLRNAVTGCRMALDLHRRETPALAESESLDVAVRQLTLMEQHVRRFLALGSPRNRPHSPLDLRQTIESVRPLVSPAARHVGVELQWSLPPEAVPVVGDSAALEQLLINLLLNAIEAAAGQPGQASDLSAVRRVELRLTRDGDSRARLEVCDTGPGPAAGIHAQLFEPLVSDKPDGTGLGLSVAQAIAEEHRGRIAWERRAERTCFWLELPLEAGEGERGETASR